MDQPEHGQEGAGDAREQEGAPVDPQVMRSPFDELLGTERVEAGPDRVVARLEVDERHHQPTGVVHGGVYAAVIETVASVGATLALEGAGAAMGIGNHTQFLRATAAGATLTFTAEPVQRGRTLQLWEVAVTDEHERAVAHGSVRLINRLG